MSIHGVLKRSVVAAINPIMRLAARSYVAGPTLHDALRVAREVAGRGHGTTLGLWDGPDDAPRDIRDGYVAALEALAAAQSDSYLSIKLPGLQFSEEFVDEVLNRSAELGVRVHFDSLDPEVADQTWAMLDVRGRQYPTIGCTIPGRWRRSVEDAERVIERGWRVRVVKGQWPDPLDPDLDLRAGYLAVIDRLAGRARYVSVATHDPVLAQQAVQRLQDAGTTCDIELLYGLPQRGSLEVAQARGVQVRVYVPYGTAYLPYVLSQAKRQPRLVWWLLKDAVGGLV